MTFSIKHAAAALILCGVQSAVAVESSGGAQQAPAVIELFTSQGCSSCPPADAVLGELSKLPNTIALAFHVDYWNGLGWPDPYALPIATERQRHYVSALGLSSAFTPQAVVDGRNSFVGSDKRRILAAMSEPSESIPVRLNIADGVLTVNLPERSDHAHYSVYLAAYLPQALTRVGRGENSGRTLQEFNIVRQFRGIGVWSGHSQVFRERLESFPTDATQVAVLIQRDRQGVIVGSAAIAIREGASHAAGG